MLFICVRIPDYKHNNIVEPLIPGSGYTTLPFDCVIRISWFAVFKNVNLALFDILCMIRETPQTISIILACLSSQKDRNAR